MKDIRTNIKRLVVALVLTLATVAPASITTNFNFTGINATVLDDNTGGYQNSQTISGITGATEISDVNVTLQISGGFNGDLYGYLVHESGYTVLLNRVGRTGGDEFGYANNGFNVTLDDGAANDIHNYQAGNVNLTGQLTGNWQADGRDTDPATALDSDSRTTSLSSFNGLDVNGQWTLFLSDMSGGDISTIQSWGLEISLVPEPTTWALIIFLTAGGLWKLRKLLRRKKTPLLLQIPRKPLF